MTGSAQESNTADDWPKAEALAAQYVKAEKHAVDPISFRRVEAAPFLLAAWWDGGGVYVLVYGGKVHTERGAAALPQFFEHLGEARLRALASNIDMLDSVLQSLEASQPVAPRHQRRAAPSRSRSGPVSAARRRGWRDQLRRPLLGNLRRTAAAAGCSATAAGWSASATGWQHRLRHTDGPTALESAAVSRDAEPRLEARSSRRAAPASFENAVAGGDGASIASRGAAAATTRSRRDTPSTRPSRRPWRRAPTSVGETRTPPPPRRGRRWSATRRSRAPRSRARRRHRRRRT